MHVFTYFQHAVIVYDAAMLTLANTSLLFCIVLSGCVAGCYGN